MVKAIYFAGKVNPPNDWREDILPKKVLYISFGVNGATYSNNAWKQRHIHLDTGKDIIYSGPYLFDGKPYGCPCLDAVKIHQLCLSSIDSSDIVFAWIDDLTAYETFAELGYAKAKGKTILMAGLDLRETCYKEGKPCGKLGNELPYIYMLADKCIIGEKGLTPLKALLSLMPPEFDSPIEKMFWDAWEMIGNYGIVLIPQYQIGRYRVDFAHEPSKTAIELDGHATHSSPDAIAYDRRREREIEASGWKVVRFGGKEVTSDACHCALEVRNLLSAYKPEESLEQPKLKPLVKLDKLDQDLKDVSLPTSVPTLTIEKVKDCWDNIQKRIRSKGNGSKIAGLLNHCIAISVENAQEPSVIVIQTEELSCYCLLAHNASYREMLEWAMKTELKQECKVRLKNPLLSPKQQQNT